MVKFLIDGAAASVKVTGDLETIVAEIGYGIKIVKESFEKMMLEIFSQRL